MEYVLNTVGHLTSPWTAALRVLAAVLSGMGAVVARMYGRPSDHERFTVGSMSADWLREYSAAAAKHRDLV